ncbi:MAG: ATP-binding cassette domain-containing protein, partial [Oscillospiraceae bacterium]
MPRGRCHGLVGPNGASKSAVIRHFTGVYRPDSGQVTLDGQPVYENPRRQKPHGGDPRRLVLFPQAQHPGRGGCMPGPTPFQLGPAIRKLGGL